MDTQLKQKAEDVGIKVVDVSKLDDLLDEIIESKADNLFTTKSGVELTLKAVPEVGLQTLLFGFVNDFNFSKSGNTQQLNERIR